jgi:pilus assembly protein CpaB
MPRKAVPDDALKKVTPEVAKLVATSTIAQGELLTRARFGDKPTTTGGLAVPEGKVAVTVEMTHPAHVGSFLKPGAQVAVYDTFNVRESYKKADVQAGDHVSDNHGYVRATRVLLSRVSVLAVDTSTSSTQDQQNDNSQASSSDAVLVTVAVTPPEALKLVHVAYTGTAHFALLNSSTTPKAGSGLNDFSLFD